MPGTTVPPLDLAGAVNIPWHFRCPISLELMRDPVTLTTGQTYDRSSIESWIATGNTTCPVTRSPLVDFTFIPNHTLRRLIQEWCVAHRSHGVERIPTPKQPADPSLVRLLVAAAASGGGADRLAALRRLRALARDSDKNRAVISSHDTRSALIEIAFEDVIDPEVESEALALLSMLPLTEAESASISLRPDRLARLAEILASDSSIESRINAAAVIEAVAVGSRSAEARAAVGEAEGVIEGLVELVDQRGNSRAVRVGIRGLFSLCLAKENRGPAVAAGAAEAVVRRIGDLVGERGGDAERALATVELLCRCDGGRDAVVAGAGGGAAAVNLLAISLKEAQILENVAMVPKFSKEDSYHQIRFISPKDDFLEDSDKTDVSDSDCTKSCAKEEQVVESCDTNQAANVLQPNIEELVNIVASNDSNGFSSLKNISSYTDFLRYVDGQLKEVETDLVDFLRLSTLILENKNKHMNTKVWQTSELLKDICSIRERIPSFIDESEAPRYRD